MPLQLNYYYGREAEQYSFFRIPKALFTDEHYKPLSMEAKVLYGLMLDRMALSAKSGWLDGSNRVYIFFTLEDAIETMGYSHTKVVRLFKELDEIGLIERKKQGLGKPAIIYVKNFSSARMPPHPEKSVPTPPDEGNPPETRGLQLTPDAGAAETGSHNAGISDTFPSPGVPDFPNMEKQTSQNWKPAVPESGSLGFQNAASIKTEYNKTEIIDTESINPPSSPAPLARDQPSRPLMDSMDRMDSYRERIRENIEYDLLCEQHPFDVEIIDGYVELMLEVCCSTRQTIRVCGQNVATGLVKKRFLSLTREHIAYVLECMGSNTAPVANIKAYTLTALYNAPVTMPQYYASLVSHDLAQEWSGG